jgi:NhaA family Na+:H+ antiporter
MASTLAALVWANSPWQQSYHDFWHVKIGVSAGRFSYALSLEQWVNDGLMAVFFLLMGLEIKRELLLGELASVSRAALPVAAAIGGMVVPALIYAAFNARGSGHAGWGVPMATDIAFAVGVLTLVGRNVPVAAKIFLLAIAIVDDLGAVLVIALFYTEQISTVALGVAGAFLAALLLLNALRVHRPLPYVLLGIGLWAAMLASGVHATIAGVLLALTIPATRQIEEERYLSFAREMLKEFETDVVDVPDKITEGQSHTLMALEEASQAVQTPLARFEHALLHPVNLVIVPIFALANAGLNLGSGMGAAARSPIMWGVLLGLLIGKPIGVMVAAWAAVRFRIAKLPAGARWGQVLGIAMLCGIGFTMSLFVTNLAFDGEENHISASKLGILIASLLSGAGGSLMIALGPKKVGGGS